jgi:Ca2+-binding EF-hand superfamily protein
MNFAGKIAALAALAAITGTMAQAQEGPEKMPKEITRGEALTMAAERFDRADTNGDGILTQDEIRASMEAMRDKMDGPRGERGDRGEAGEHGDRGDHDKAGPRGDRGEGDMAKGKPSPEKHFEKIDADASGTVSLEEFMAVPKKMAEHRKDMDPERGDALAKKAFERMDVDADGTLTVEEFTTGMEKMKDRRDNHEGPEPRPVAPVEK